MHDWTSGYVADVNYTFGYYPELNPLRVKLAFLHAGVKYPEFGTACELGFGQGLSINVHAAASITQWYGTDFNPAQAGFAQELAAASAAHVHLHDDAFADFAKRTDLPDFDYIGLHGIWSWISDENRQTIVDFLARKLKVGGVLYVSYNTLPGWAAFAPMRHLLTEHAQVLGAPGAGMVPRIDNALTFMEKLLATQPGYPRNHPQALERFNKVKVQDRHYLAHEYFNRDWQPMYFATMADHLAPAKLSYVTSAHYPDNIDAANLLAEQRNMLQEISDPNFRESVRDFMVNQQFRRDYWVRGIRKLPMLEQFEALRALRVILLTPPSNLGLTMTSALGDVSLNESIYTPLISAMADYQVRSIAQIEQVVKGNGLVLEQVIQALVVLAGIGHVALVQDEQVIAAAKPATDRLNRHLINKARSRSEINHLASPVIGGGVLVGNFQQLCLLAIFQGKQQPADWAALAWQYISGSGQKIMKEGRVIESGEDSLTELTVQARTFAEKQLPILKALRIA